MNDIALPRATEAAGVGADRPKGLSDDDLLELVQRQTFRFFWDGAHPVSGLARDRTNVQDKYGPEAMAIGGTGFGAIAIIVATERGWISRAEAVDQLLKMVKFLHLGAHFHGVLPHFMHGTTGQAIAFSRKDDGSDVVEMAFLIGGLLCVRQYFDGDGKEAELRDRINTLWQQTEWDWHTRGGRHIMYWHWSPNQGWGMDFEIRGWNECLLTYVLGAVVADLSDPQRSLPSRLGDGPGVQERARVLRHQAAARPRFRRPAVLDPILLHDARSQRPERPLCRLLGAKHRPHPDQP